MAPTVLQKNTNAREVLINRLRDVYQLALLASADNTKIPHFKVRYPNIESWLEEFQQYHIAIITSLEAPEDLSAQDKIRADVDTLYFDIKMQYETLCSLPAAATSNSQASPSTLCKLGRVNIPVFDGKMAEWQGFIDLYNSLIHTNDSLADIVKFQYLITSVTKDPLQIVKTVPLCASNYAVAYKTLVDRYQNKRLLATNYWNAINNAPALSSENSRGLRILLDTFSENLIALKHLSLPTDSWDFILFQMMFSKIDSATRKRFELQSNSSDIPQFKDLTNFLENQYKALEACASTEKNLKSRPQHINKINTPAWKTSVPSPASSFVVNTQSLQVQACVLCKDNHFIAGCPTFLEKSPKERFDIVKQYNLCTNCLSSSHKSLKCKSRFSCQKCRVRHHTLLHFPPATPSAESSSAQPVTLPVGEAASSSNVSVLTNSLYSQSVILLSTAVAEILTSRGDYEKVRLLIDTGSQASFITKDCQRKLGLPSSHASVPISGLGHMTGIASSGITTCKLRPVGSLEPTFVLEAIVLNKICSNMPSTPIDASFWRHIAGLNLADPNFYTPGPIDMLVGADIFPLILKPGRICGKVNEPMAINTVFGYIIMGKVSQNAPSINSLLVSVDHSLNETLTKFWETEEVPSTTQKPSSEEVLCENIYKKTTIRNSLGRYVVQLPFKEPPPTFADSRSVALNRFYSLERRLLRDSDVRASYVQFMDDYFQQGHMELITNPANTNISYYIPHHCVLKPDSTTTRLRVVFDASAHNPQGKSLNQHLLIGPKLQKDIVSVLLRFRLHNFVFTADIKQMYRQILIAPEHRDFQRILWRSSPEKPIQEFRLNTVTYGVTSAPYLALRTIMQLASDEGDRYPLAARVLKEDVYVDDVVSGCSSLSETLLVQKQLSSLLQCGGFELRKWASNNPDCLAGIPDTHQAVSFDTNEPPTLKILGLQWLAREDAFVYQINSLEHCCTKRSILSDLARIFDPLGFLAPVTFFAKHLIQVLWTFGLTWDQEPPIEIINQWLQFKSELPNLKNVTVPRRLLVSDAQNIEIHGFCDASERGYAAVIYFRSFSKPEDAPNSSLVIAKSKVAPLKKLSVPRLELCGAVLLSNLIKYVVDQYSPRLSFHKVVAWCDSTVALSWIKSPSYKWKTFVANRVSHIQEIVAPDCWYHIRSGENPADCASRGLTPDQLSHHLSWWAGPTFLRDVKASFDVQPNTPETSLDALSEERRHVFVAQVNLNWLHQLLHRFSSLRKIQGTVAYLLRFIHNTRSKNKSSGPLSSLELHDALILIVKVVQSVAFSNDISQIRENKLTSKPIRKFAPFLDENNLLRVGGRLRHSSLSNDEKHPLLLPRSHRLTELIIEHFHNQNLHPGIQTLHFLLLQQFWILSARRAIKQCISKCYRCFKVNPSPILPPMADLPSPRVSQLKPFSHTGVDFAGPLLITLGKHRGAKTSKAYICVFVCMAVKAIHLELVSDLSSDAFLAAFRRFVARRGRCSDLYSDCGKNFVGANKILLAHSQESAATLSIKWHFNPPSAPHFGGIWEAGVKSVKTHLHRVIGEQRLTYEEMNTFLVQIEAVVNSRPLSPTSSDPNDLQALSPGHFLTLEPLTSPPDRDLSGINLNRLRRWELLQGFYQHFWHRWSTEYLHTLQQRSKWHKNVKTPALGTLVLIKHDHLPPLQWSLGRITELHSGPDGVYRIATLRTTNGLIKRPMVKLCPLPNQ